MEVNKLTTPRAEIAKYINQSTLSNYFIDTIGLVSVKSFKAVGDGVTDDTRSILDAILYCADNGLKSLYFPHGVYLTSLSSIQFSAIIKAADIFLWGDNSVFSGSVSYLINQIGTNIAEYATKQELIDVILGQIPDGTLTTAKMAAEQKRGSALGVAGLDAAGQVPFTQLTSIHDGTHIYAATSTGNDTYVLTFSPALGAYNAGLVINIGVDVGNTGAATVNIDNLGAKAIKKISSSGLVDIITGDMYAGGIYSLIDNGTYFLLTNPNSINKSVAGTAYQSMNMKSDASEVEFQSSLQSLIAAKGDLIVGDSANTPVKKSMGTASQYLRVNSAGTDLEYGALTKVASAGANGQANLNGQAITGTHVWTIDMGITPEQVQFTILNAAGSPCGMCYYNVNKSGGKAMFYMIISPFSFSLGDGSLSYSMDANDVYLFSAVISGTNLVITFTAGTPTQIACAVNYSAI
jgi:hypothetical protein